jgi:hypothetical protein
MSKVESAGVAVTAAAALECGNLLPLSFLYALKIRVRCPIDL